MYTWRISNRRIKSWPFRNFAIAPKATANIFSVLATGNTSPVYRLTCQIQLWNFLALRYSLKRALPLNKRALRNRDFLDEHVPSTKPLRHSIIFVFNIFYVIIAAVIVIKKGFWKGHTLGRNIYLTQTCKFCHSQVISQVSWCICAAMLTKKQKTKSKLASRETAPKKIVNCNLFTHRALRSS